jgi:hypothetical protein
LDFLQEFVFFAHYCHYYCGLTLLVRRRSLRQRAFICKFRNERRKVDTDESNMDFVFSIGFTSLIILEGIFSSRKVDFDDVEKERSVLHFIRRLFSCLLG